MRGVRTVMRDQDTKVSNSSGFTLVELAIVLVIVGILVGAGASMVGVLSTAIKVRQTKDSLDENMQAVASWASANNRLPSTGEFSSPVSKTPQDAWGRDFVYIYDSNLVAIPATKDTICGRRATFLNLSTSDPAAYMTNVAYAVASRGDSSTFQSTLTGGTVGVIANTAVAAATTIHVDRNHNDIVRWVTLDELRSKIGCQGGPLKIINNELPFIPSSYAVSSPFATIAADGGVPITGGGGNFTWCVEFAPRRGISMFDTVPSVGIKTTGVGTSCWASAETVASGFVQSTTFGLQKKALMGNFSTGSYQITITARDGASTPANTAACSTNPGDNCIQKTFILTVNPN